VTTHAPGTMLLVTFPDWPVGPRGTYAVTCSTQLATDANKVNDKVAAQTTVRIQDVGAIGVMEPVGTVNLNQTVRPKLKVKNLGNTSATFDVQFVINSGASPVYQDSGRVVGLRSGAESTVTFARTWTATPRGNYTTVGWVRATGDVNPANDTIRGNFSVVEGGGGYPWVAKAPIPGKPVKDGGWLAYDASTRLVYGANGNKSPDFSAYNPTKDSWYPKAGIPPGTEGKPPSKGAAGFGDGNGAIYATKGNNTQGFWKYDCASDAWTQKKDVPLGPSNKKVKGGTDLVVAEDSGGKKSVYLLKGYKNEFYKYDPIADDWRQMPDAPAGGNPKYDKGSWLAYAPHMHKIFAHKAKFHEFYSFNTLTDSWDPAPLKGMPMEGSGGSKKSKDGGCATYHDSALYAFKGGNTQEFWKYSIPANSWTEKETLPKAMKKKVKSGADITTFPLGSDGDLPGTPAELPAIPGNKTNNLWAYSTPGGSGYTNRTPDRDGVMAETGRSLEQFLELVPNPLTGGLLTLRYGLKGGGVAVVCIYDVTGRLALPPALISGRSGTAALDLRSLESGVYLLKARGAGFAAVRKLVIDR